MLREPTASSKGQRSGVCSVETRAVLCSVRAKPREKYLDNSAVSQSQRLAGEGAQKARQKHHGQKSLFALVIALLIRCARLPLQMQSEVMSSK